MPTIVAAIVADASSLRPHFPERRRANHDGLLPAMIGKIF